MSKPAKNSFEAQIQEQLAISKAELELAMQDNMAVITQYEKNVESLHVIFSTPEEDAEAEKELAALAKEMGVSFDFHDSEERDLEQQIKAMPDLADIESLELESLLKDLDEIQVTTIEKRSESVSTLLQVHSDMALQIAQTSSKPEEVAELTNFSQSAKTLSASIDANTTKHSKSENNRENSHKFISNIGVAIGKLYGSIKSGVSSAIDSIKKLGVQIGKAIGSIFNKSAKQQNVEFSKAINESGKTAEKIAPTKEGIANAKAILNKEFLKLQQDYAKIIPAERQKVFQKWRDKKNANIDKVSLKDMLSDVQKIRKSIITQKKRNLEDRRDQRAPKGRKTPPEQRSR